MLFGYLIWSIPNIFTVMLVRNLDCIVQNIELRWRHILESEKLKKYLK